MFESHDLQLTVAHGIEWGMCAGTLAQFHYLHTFPDPRCMPMVYSVRLRKTWVGALVFGRPEASRCFRGGITYGGRADLAAGRCRYDRWEVLNLARVWLLPEIQSGGSAYSPELLPGFVDRKGAFRSSLASTVIHRAIEQVRVDYLLWYPPCFLAEPYQVRAVLSYCDTRVHRGTIYRASGFSLAGTNRAGVETWWTDCVNPLDADEDAQVREASRKHARSQKKRRDRSHLTAQLILGLES